MVYAGSWRGMTVAVKVMRGGLCERAEAEADRERAVHRRLRHPNIVAMLGFAGVPGGAYALVFQYCSQGVLNVRKLGGFSNAPRVLGIALDVARALEYAHRRGVIHRDVKPSQVLLDCCGRAMLADWGLSCTVGSAECTVAETGTFEFMAPEVINCTSPYNTSADVYSFGILLWCLLAGETYPFEADFLTPEQAARAVARGTLRPRRLALVDANCPQVSDLMQLCWAQNPNERPTMTNILDSLLAIREDIVKQNAKEQQQQATSGGSWWGLW